MRILHLTTTDAGGAGRAAVRLHRALRDSEVDSQLLVARGTPKADGITGLTALDRNRRHRWRRGIQRRIDDLPLRLTGKKTRPGWSAARFPGGVLPEIRKLSPDLIHLHWVTGFLSIEEMTSLRQWPIVWSLHDLWPLSEGYHYLGGLDGVDVTQSGDLSRLSDSTLGDWIWKRKQRAYEGIDLRTIGLSRWIHQAAGESPLLAGKPGYHIPNCLPPETIFEPGRRAEARRKLELPEDRPLLLFGAADSEGDRRKGFDLLLETLTRLEERTSSITRPDLVIFGSDSGPGCPDEYHGFRLHRMGRITDDHWLAALYNAADVFVAPSREDNLPNTVMEAMACGTPCAAFDIGGLGDLIKPGDTGFLAPPFDTEILADGLLQLLASDFGIRDRCAAFVRRRFSPEVVIPAMREVYREALGLAPCAGFSDRSARRGTDPIPALSA